MRSIGYDNSRHLNDYASMFQKCYKLNRVKIFNIIMRKKYMKRLFASIIN